MSGLLPRRDWDTRELEDINFNIARKILDLPNAHFVPHHNLFLTNTVEILNDKKRLNEQDFKIFLKNLKDCLLGRNFSKAAFIQYKFHGPRQARNNPGKHSLKILQHQGKEPGEDKVQQPIIIRITLAQVERRASTTMREH